MSAINDQPGVHAQQQNQQVVNNAALKHKADVDKKAEVKSGDLKGDNLKISVHNGETVPTGKPGIATPTLDRAPNVSVEKMQNASKEIAGLSQSTDAAMVSTEQMIENIMNGKLTDVQKEQLKQYAKTLDDTGEYLDLLSGKNLDTPEGKRMVLAGMGGFSKTQLDNLQQLIGSDDVDAKLAPQHGGIEIYSKKVAVLKSLGYNENQIKTLMSLAPKDTDGKTLEGMRAAAKSNDPEAVLKALGFSESAASRLSTMVTGQQLKAGSEEQKQLLTKMGFGEDQAKVILLASDPDKLKTQDILLRSGNLEESSELIKANSTGLQLLSEGKTFPDQKVLEQLVDIFAVMELLHKMSVTQRSSAREQRQLQYKASVEETLNQAAEMKEAALKTAIGGWVSAGTKMVAGAVQIGMSARSMNLTDQGTMQAQVAVANGISQVIGASGDMAKASFDFQAGLHQAQVKHHEAYQKTHDNAAQSESEFMNLHQDMQKTILSKMDEIIRSWFETLKSTTRA